MLILSCGRDSLRPMFSPLRGAPDVTLTRAQRKHGRVPRQLCQHWQLHLEPLVLVHAPVGVQFVPIVDEVHDRLRLAQDCTNHKAIDSKWQHI